MSSSGSDELLPVSEESVRSIISWQQQRFQHLQTLSQGLLSVLLALATIAITLFSVFRNDIPKISPSAKELQDAATGLPITQTTTAFTVILNGFLLIGLFSAFVFLLIEFLSDVFTSLTQNPPDSHYPSTGTAIPEEIPLHEQFDMGSAVDRFRENLKANSEKVGDTEQMFISSALRLILILVFAGLAAHTYYLISSADVLSLVFLNSILFVPPIMAFSIDLISQTVSDNPEQSEGNILTQTYFISQENKWEDLEFNLFERGSILFSTTISAVVLILWVADLVSIFPF
jgi:hypothetical protein